MSQYHSKLVFWLCLLALPACAPIYTPETTWYYDDPKIDEDFRPDLTECVQDYDRPHLYEMDNGGEYQPTGWFIDTARTQAVVSCMEAKGWDADRWDR